MDEDSAGDTVAFVEDGDEQVLRRHLCWCGRRLGVVEHALEAGGAPEPPRAEEGAVAGCASIAAGPPAMDDRQAAAGPGAQGGLGHGIGPEGGFGAAADLGKVDAQAGQQLVGSLLRATLADVVEDLGPDVGGPAAALGEQVGDRAPSTARPRSMCSVPR